MTKSSTDTPEAEDASSGPREVSECIERRQLWQKIFETTFPPSPGGVLAFFTGLYPAVPIAAEFDLVIRCFGDHATRKPLYGATVHIWPGAIVGRDIPGEFAGVVTADAKTYEAPEDVIREYLQKVTFVAADSLDSCVLVGRLAAVPPRSAVYVHCAQLYRFADPVATSRPAPFAVGELKMNMAFAEDLVSDHAERLVLDALRVANDTQSVIVLAFESNGFAHDMIPAALMDVEGFAVANLPANESQAKLRAECRYCLAQPADLSVDDSLARLRACGDSALNTAIFFAGVLSARSLHRQAWTTLEVEYSTILACNFVGHILFSAQVACSAGETMKVAELLGKAWVCNPIALEQLATLHTLYDRIGDTTGAGGALERLIALFPNSPRTKAKQLTRSLRTRDFASARILAHHVGDRYLMALCDCLAAPKVQFTAFIAAAKVMGKKDEAYRDLAIAAFDRGRYGAAWWFLRHSVPCSDTVPLLCRSLGKRVIRSRRVCDRMVGDLRLIMQYVALHPGDLDSRFALERLLEEDIEEGSSVIFLCTILDREATRLFRLASSRKPTRESPWVLDASIRSESDDRSYETLREFLMGDSTMTVPGVGDLPDAIKAKVSNKTLYDWSVCLEHGGRCENEDDRACNIRLLHCIMLLARHLNDPTTDFLPMRHIVTALCSAGLYQEGRDLAETALLALPFTQPAFRCWRLALGWACVGEAFLRSNNPLAALRSVCLATLSVSDYVASAKGAKELLRLCTRVSRENRIWFLALKYLSFERHVMQQYSLELDLEYELEHIEHAIRSKEAIAEGSVTKIEALIQAGFAFLSRPHGNQPAPMLSTLAALMSRFKQLRPGGGLEYDHSFAEHAQRSSPYFQELVTSQANLTPDLADLRRLAVVVGNANSVSDLSYQGRPLRILAERAIAFAYQRQDIPLFVGAANLLSQPGLAERVSREESEQREPDTNAINAALYRYVEGEGPNVAQLADLIQEKESGRDTCRASLLRALDVDIDALLSVARKDEQILVLAHDGIGQLYQLSLNGATAGEIRCLSPESWSPQRYREWRKTHPYAYGSWKRSRSMWEPDTPSILDVKDTVRGLTVEGLTKKVPSILVTDSELFGFPFGISSLGEEFAGAVCQYACVPSLDWLRRSRNVQASFTDRRLAWLGVPGKRDWGWEGMAQKLERDLSHHSFETQTTTAPTFSDAVIGVVACHGVVGHFGQFVAVAPDRTRLFTIDEFARQFESIGCLVLLICSAGRGDERTHTSESRSLVSLLLERGVRTIVAPVWPLDMDVATVWLPQFLSHVMSGTPVGVAAFDASRAVRELFPNPCAWATLQVYGDFWLNCASAANA